MILCDSDNRTFNILKEDIFMKKYLIKDLVGKHDLTVMEAASGKSALKKFYQSHMMNSGFYEFIQPDN